MLFRSASATSPGRCEIVMRKPTIIIDAAHNPHGAVSLKRTLSEEFDFESIIGIVAPMGDKDVDGILEELEAVVSQIIVTRNTSHRAADIDELQSSASQIFRSERVRSAGNLHEAISLAIDQARMENAINDTNTAIVITGSVVTAGEARAIVRKLKENKR